MVKINFNAFDDLSTEEIKNELIKYKNSGYKWKKFLCLGCQIWAPNFFIEGEELINYFKNIKLKVGNREQKKMFDALNLTALLHSKNNRYDNEWEVY